MNNHQVTSRGDGQPRFFYGYVIILASFLLLMIAWGAQYSFGIFFKPVLNEFGWTRAATSGAYSLSTLLLGIAGIFAGRLNDRFGPRVIISVCGLFMGLGYLLMSQVSAIWQIYLFYGVLMSIGLAGMFVPLMSTVARWFIKRRGLATGIVASGIGVGVIVMPPLANQLISRYGWRISYVVVGSMALVVTIAIAQFLKRDPGHTGIPAAGPDAANGESAGSGVHGCSLQEALRARQFWTISVMFLCSNFCLQIAMVHIVPHATDIGISAAAAATILSVIGAVSIGSKLGTGSIVDMIGNKRLMTIVLVLMSVSFLWLLFARELWMLYLFAAVFGVAYGGFVVAESPMVAEYFGLKAHGAIFGASMFLSNVGGAVGSLVAGRIFDMTGSYEWAFALCAILGVAGLILCTSLKAARLRAERSAPAYSQ